MRQKSFPEAFSHRQHWVGGEQALSVTTPQGHSARARPKCTM
jgi:hypothetical protein